MVNYYNASIIDAKHGDVQVSKLVYGSETVWEHTQPVTGNYFATVARTSGTITFSGSASGSNTNVLSYSLNGGSWSTASQTPEVSVSAGDKVLWKGTCTPDSSNGIGKFTTSSSWKSAQFDVEGNAMSLLYGDDFEEQTSLIGKAYAFYRLFTNNTKVINAENLSLPATTLDAHSYHYMFENCSSLTTAPSVLPATTLADRCYEFMFDGCTSLTTAPALSATTLAQYCYEFMFSSCRSLTTAPALPATTLALGCYRGMFQGCSSLTTAPELPVTSLKTSCYEEMFGGCTSLTVAPELPATRLETRCYQYMFSGCSSLVSAPELPATTLTNSCYDRMFSGCSSLNSITCLATNISATNCTGNWVSGVAATGTFIKPASMTGWTTGSSGIPDGWTVDEPANAKYLTTVATTNGRIVFSGRSASVKLQYSKNSGATWSTASQKPSVSVSAGEKVLWKGSTTGSQIGAFTSACTANFNVEGNIMSLIYGDNFSTQTTIPDGTSFGWLFDRNTKVISAENMSLPATTLARMCYMCMFAGCTNLTKAPKLPAKTLTIGCYTSMFQGCTSLTSAPSVLPAMTLTEDCYGSMFDGCTSLTTAPALPATTLATTCYRSMFSNCTSLTSAPSVLPAMTMADRCYLYMFRGCTSLTTAPELPATTLATTCYRSMFTNCTSLTTAPSVLPAKTLTEESYWGMFIGCTSLTTSPVLPDATMAKDCYWGMFSGCTSLNRITCLAHEPDAVYSYSTDWVSNVAATGTFAKYPLATWSTGTSGMPDGWTVVNAEYPKYQAVINGHEYSAQCDGNTTITSSATKPAGYDVSGITSAEIGPCITSIGDYAFDSCGSLSSVYVPSTITSIGQYAFRGCSSLASITISDSIASIGNGAYQNCTGLNRIVVDATVPPTLGSNVFDNTNNCQIIVPCDSLEAYRQAWSQYADRIDCSNEFPGKCMLLDDGGVEHSFACNGDTVIHQGEYNDVFDNYTITVVMIGSCCTEIEMGAFDRKSFSDLTIGSNVQSIGEMAFAFVDGLIDVHVLATTPPTIDGDPFMGFHGTIYVPVGTVEDYQDAWPDYADRITEEGSSPGA